MEDESKLPVIYRKKLPTNLEKIKYGSYTKDDYDYPIHTYLQENDVRIDENGSDIIKFLRGKNVLVTGATGFLGKLLLEKLLRCCKDIGTIYILIRTKNDKDSQTRVDELLGNLIFYRLSEIYPDFKKKVVGIPSDFLEPGLGLSEESKKLIADEVNLIYHVAATVKFHEKIKIAVAINLKGTYEMMKIAKSCKNLEAFTYVSTAFSNCQNKHIKEYVYEPIIDPYELINITERASDNVLGNISTGLLSGMPNTYVLTKQIAESIVKREGAGLPVCIQRPSIVIATAREPVRNWVANLFGPVGLLQATAFGLLHVIKCNGDGLADLIPADYVINNCIAASYKTAVEKSPKVQIYNYTCPRANQLKWKNLRLAAPQGVKVGSTYILWKFFYIHITNHYIYSFFHFLFHMLPAYCESFVFKLLGKKPILGMIYKKVGKFMDALSYFALNEWSFDIDNTNKLWKSLNDKDKKNFAFDINTLDWTVYFETYAVALREFLLLEFLDNLKEGRATYRRMVIAHYTAILLLVGGSIYFFINTYLWFIPVGIIFIILCFIYDQMQSLEFGKQ